MPACQWSGSGFGFQGGPQQFGVERLIYLSDVVSQRLWLFFAAGPQKIANCLSYVFGHPDGKGLARQIRGLPVAVKVTYTFGTCPEVSLEVFSIRIRQTTFEVVHRKFADFPTRDHATCLVTLV